MSRRAAARLLLLTTTTTTTKTLAPQFSSSTSCSFSSACRGASGGGLPRGAPAHPAAPARHTAYHHQQQQVRGMAALPAAGGARHPMLAAGGSRRVCGGGGGGGGALPARPPPAAALPRGMIGGGGGAGGGGGGERGAAAAAAPPQPPPPALLLAAARVARHRAAAAAAGAGAGGGGATWTAAASRHQQHHHQRAGRPAPPRVASPAPSAQGLVGADPEVDDDGEPRVRKEQQEDEEGKGVDGGAAATTAAAAAAAAAPLLSPPPLGGGGGPSSARAYSNGAAGATAAAAAGNAAASRRGDDGEQDDESAAAAAASAAAAAAAQEEDDLNGAGSELHAVNTAIRANALIFLAKIAAALASGSAAMFAEAVHSLVDVANQTLLRIGILKARRAPTEAHPLGFARDQFIWPLISAVGIFCCGAGVSLVHGVAGLLEPARELGDLTASYAVLAVSLALESHSLVVAVKTLRSRAARHGLPLAQYLRTGADPAATAVMMEDGAAVAGLLIAGGCLAACQITGSAVFDSAGSVAVALLLGGVAVTLIQRNRLFLIGRAMPPEAERRVLRYLESDPVIRRVRNARSEELGVRAYRFYGEIAFDGGEMARRCLDRVGRRRLFGALAAAAAARDASRMDALMTAYSAAVVSATGAEVDRLERQISALVPGIRHVDLETDREAAGPLVTAAAADAAAGRRRRRGAREAAVAAGGGGSIEEDDDEEDDADVYDGAQLLLDGEASSASAASAPARPGGSGEAEEAEDAARAWLDAQLPPDGSGEARRARPSLSAAAYREREKAEEEERSGGGDAFVADKRVMF